MRVKNRTREKEEHTNAEKYTIESMQNRPNQIYFDYEQHLSKSLFSTLHLSLRVRFVSLFRLRQSLFSHLFRSFSHAKGESQLLLLFLSEFDQLHISQ